MKKLGFTLAEVLITLGIIGVVAALTMPTLIANTKYKQIGVKLAKFHTNLENASRTYVVANGDFNANLWNSSNAFDNDTNVLTNFLDNVFIIKETHNSDGSLNDSQKILLNHDGENYYLNHQNQEGGIPYIVLKDGTSITCTTLVPKVKKISDDNGKQKYGELLNFYISFDPQVSGLPDNAQKLFSFAMTTKGIIFPDDDDKCLVAISNNKWKVDSNFYKKNGVCTKSSQ